MRVRNPGVLGALILIVAEGRASAEMPGIAVRGGSTIRLGDSDSVTRFGAFQASIRNDSADRASFELTLLSSVGPYGRALRVSVSRTLVLEPGAQANVQLVAAVGLDRSHPASGRIELMHSGPYDDSVSFSVAERPFAWTSSVAKFGSPLFASGDVPSDWRSLAALTHLWMSPADFDTAPPGFRRTLGEWLAQGGRLRIVVDGSTPLPSGLPPEGTVGLGSVDPLRSFEMAPQIELTRRTWFMTYNGSPEPNHEFLALVGRPSMRWLLIVFLGAFGILVGPINLAWLAPRARRIRAIWTTPLLSVGSGFALIALLLSQEGLGGRGERRVAVRLVPSEGLEVIFQDQISRTGLLLSSSFELPKDSLLEIIPIDDPSEVRFDVAGSRCSGGFFSSVSTQAQRIELVRPSRAGLDVDWTGDKPKLVSRLPVRVTRVHWLDDAGRVWRADDVAPGARVELVAVEVDMEVLLVNRMATFTTFTKDRFLQPIEPGTFIAEARDLGSYVAPTLEGIEWNTVGVIVGSVGELAKRERGAAGESGDGGER
ncbi:MAG: hypothetical protein HY791_27910 [Deltaproteobacteria bacterium]|nr:hypothetical protein [Deltaproteobacteria bacterium]